MDFTKTKPSINLCKISKDRERSLLLKTSRHAGSVKLANISLQKNDGVRTTYVESLSDRAFYTLSLLGFWVLFVFFQGIVKGQLLRTPIPSGNPTLTLALVMEKTSPCL